MRSLLLFVLTSACVLPSLAFAWGRRGHQIVGETAAQVVDGEPGGEGLRAHSFDVAYYANVPDIVWKRPATFDIERPQHYMDMDVIEPALKKHPEIKNPLALSRAEFDAKFPEVEFRHGRGFWRIREILGRLEAVTAKLKDASLPKKPHQTLQQEWITLAGILGHYVGDLGMPLHVFLDYDAEKTNQKGVHRFFEENCVDFYYPQLAVDVLNETRRKWPAFTKKNSGADVIDMLIALTAESTAAQKVMLDIDKKSDRKVAHECPRFKSLIQSRLVASSLILAELYRRNLAWTFDDVGFFMFHGEPAYVPLGNK